MKERFTTIDVLAIVNHLNGKLLGMRLANVYDVDHKTYLLKLARSEEKAVLLFESGCRMHVTEFEWPKNLHPSGFSMKLRKHLRTKRLTGVTQLGADRVVDLQFGSGEATHHLLVELYDRGNVILTDHAYTILTLLRTRTDADMDVRFATRQTFSMDTIKQEQPPPALDRVTAALESGNPGDQLKHVLNRHFVYGPALLAHSLIGVGFSENAKLGTDFVAQKDMDRLMSALTEADTLFHSLRHANSKGFIIQKKEAPVQIVPEGASGEKEPLLTNVEFHPVHFRQHQSAPIQEYETFNQAVDHFFSLKTSQKHDIKTVHLQKSAMKKLDNIRQDHQKRIENLQKSQAEDIRKAELIELNADLVERASLVIRSAVANAMDWGDIDLLVKEAQGRGDPVAMAIHSLKLSANQITLLLRDFDDESDEDEDDEQDLPKKRKKKAKKGTKVDVDLGLSAYANARKYYVQRRHAVNKENKTIDASAKALKSAERKAKQTLKEAAVVSRIHKARKTHWFEKFYWFISSENYLLIGGRDRQQNELVVKKYLNDDDLYVHADLHGATSVVIRNPNGGPVPPKTLNEAGVMAVCYSSAWEAKVVTSAWWVYAHQVSKTAPTGEYLTTGSFMIRGKKNFLLPCQLTLGFGIMFKLDETCIKRHLNERRVREMDDDQLFMLSEATGELGLEEEVEVMEEEDEETSRNTPNSEMNIEHEVEEGQGSESEEDDHSIPFFPDTTIQIQHRGGNRFELQRSISESSPLPESTPVEADLAMAIDEANAESSHRHMSAKQRRMAKKQGKQRMTGSVEEQVPQRSHLQERKTNCEAVMKQSQPPPPQQYKRGQKFKQKRIKERYGDQDEEERLARMEILASAGTAKVGKKDKKNKKRDPTKPTNPKVKYRQRENEKGEGWSRTDRHHSKQQAPLFVPLVKSERNAEPEDGSTNRELAPMEETKMAMEVEDLEEDDVDQANGDGEDDFNKDGAVACFKDATEIAEDGSVSESLAKPLSQIEHPASASALIEPTPPAESDEDEKRAILAEENLLQVEEAKKESVALDSLTGCPLPDDIFLYAVPVCAPYSAILNYKYKVKLIPGPNRRGKAAKTAVFKFLQSKEASPMEKDLLRSIKDNDLSRYFPGKVKMTVPQNLRTHR